MVLILALVNDVLGYSIIVDDMVTRFMIYTGVNHVVLLKEMIDNDPPR